MDLFIFVSELVESYKWHTKILGHTMDIRQV